MNAAGAVQLRSLMTMILSIVREPNSVRWTHSQNSLIEKIYVGCAYRQDTPVMNVIEKETDAHGVSCLIPNYCLILRYCHYKFTYYYLN